MIIYTEWPGRSPDLVEDQITYPITSTLLAAPKVQAVRGFSYLGSSFIYVIFEEGTDIYWARSRILEYLQAVKNKIPADVNPVLGPDATSLGWGFSYAVVDETGGMILPNCAPFRIITLSWPWKAFPAFPRWRVSAGLSNSIRSPSIPTAFPHTTFPSPKSWKRSARATGMWKAGSWNFPAWSTWSGDGDISRASKIWRNIAVGTNRGGTPIYLKDVARIQLGPEIRRGLAELDGKGEVAGGIVVVRFGENVLNVIERVKEKIKKDIAPSLPKGVKIVTTYDRSDLIHRSIDTLKEEIIKLAIAVSVVCIVFLFHLPSALVVILTLPMAIIMSFICMFYLGVTSNIMSLSGIAIAIGAMVDASIIMVENAHKKLEEWEAAGEGRATGRM